ncbi:MAG: sulfite exporter TauE/SafE family protein [Lachnospiraceae bacterium]|nr:sulfite exporter TauE/SafE family protein [Lachnospiraceae bacterium]
MSKQIHLEIGGMTCINCQNRIEKALKKMPGVIKAAVSYTEGTADVEYAEDRTSRKKIVETIEKLDYKVLPFGKRGIKDFLPVIILPVIIILLYYLLQRFGLLNYLVPADLADSSMGYGMLFVIGLITSVHCIAMCGGIGISRSLSDLSDRGSESKGKLGFLLPSLSYNLGRVVSYTFIGFVLGFAGMLIGGGKSVGMPLLLQGILKIVAGLLMVIMGINTLGIFPFLKRFSIHTPLVITKMIGKKRAAAGSNFVIGLLNGIMPCGPLQSMWIVALVTANPFAGALSMFLFSLGTVPLMLSLGSAVSFLGKKFAAPVMRVGGVMVVVMGLAVLTQGGALSGMIETDLLFYLIIALFVIGVIVSIMKKNSWMKYVGPAAAVAALALVIFIWNQGAKEDKALDKSSATSEAGFQRIPIAINQTDAQTDTQTSSQKDTQTNAQTEVQEVESTLTLGRYPEITVQAGVPVKWTINAPQGSINGCNAVMIIQDYGIQHTFNVGENIIEFTPDEPGSVMYSCWMGMVYGRINVVE